MSEQFTASSSGMSGEQEESAVRDATGAGWRERIFGSREYFWLFLAQLSSAFGDWIGFFAIAALAATISDAPEAAIALVITARVAPSVVLAPVMGVVVDRFDRRRLMIFADVARAGVFCALPFVRTVTGLVVASLILEIFTLIWSPAKEALVPSLVPKDKLASANSLGLVAAYGTMPFAGLAQFGLKKWNDALADVAWMEPLQFNAELGETQALAFYVNALSFLVTAAIIWRCIGVSDRSSAPADVDGVGVEERRGLGGTVDGIREGWQFIFLSPVIRSVHIGLAAGLLGGAMLIPLGPLFAEDILNDPDTFALFITALGVGVAVGVSLVSATQRRLPLESTFVASLVVASIAVVYAVSMSSFWLAALGVMVLGVCAGSVYVLGFTMLHRETDDDLRGRIFSTLLILVRLCVLLALWLGPVLAVWLEQLADAVVDGEVDGIPAASVAGTDVVLAGSRLALWLAGVIIMGAAVAAGRSMQVGLRSSLRDVRAVGTQLRVRRTVPPIADTVGRIDESGDIEDLP